MGTATATNYDALAGRLQRLHELHDEASELMAAHNDYWGGSWELRVQAPGAVHTVLYTNLDAYRGEKTLIERLFDQWCENRRVFEAVTDQPQIDTLYAEYVSLQKQIIEQGAVTPRDFGIQVYVDSDAGGSENSEGFLETLARLVADPRRADGKAVS